MALRGRPKNRRKMRTLTCDIGLRPCLLCRRFAGSQNRAKKRRKITGCDCDIAKTLPLCEGVAGSQNWAKNAARLRMLTCDIGCRPCLLKGGAMTEQETRALLNQVLKKMFYRVLRLQEKSVSRAASANLSRTEMHALEVIQDCPGATLTQIAEMLDVTKATVSVSVNRLVQKGFLKKTKMEDDRQKARCSSLKREMNAAKSTSSSTT